MRGFRIPAEFWAAFGYSGDARFVAIYWEPSGDEACYCDGGSSGTADWMAYNLLMEANKETFYDLVGREPWAVLGCSDLAAVMWLVCDRETGYSWLTPVRHAREFLRGEQPDKNGEFTADDMEAVVQALARLQFVAVETTDLDRRIAEHEKALTALETALAEG